MNSLEKNFSALKIHESQSLDLGCTIKWALFQYAIHYIE